MQPDCEVLDVQIHLLKDNDASFEDNSFVCNSIYIEDSVNICKTEQITIPKEFMSMKDVLHNAEDYNYE